LGIFVVRIIIKWIFFRFLSEISTPQDHLFLPGRAVQEIADALTGVNIPILIKNPANSDLDFWIGAM